MLGRERAQSDVVLRVWGYNRGKVEPRGFPSVPNRARRTDLSFAKIGAKRELSPTDHYFDLVSHER